MTHTLISTPSHPSIHTVEWSENKSWTVIFLSQLREVGYDDVDEVVLLLFFVDDGASTLSPSLNRDE